MLPVRMGGGRRRVHYYPGHNIQTSKKWRCVWEIVNQPQEERDLSGKNLSGANLRGASLEWADLEGANVTDDQLAQAKSLKGATMPDGTKHD